MEELIGHSESKEGLEQKLILLDSQLRVRDDDIKNVKKTEKNIIFYLLLLAKTWKIEYGNKIESITKRL